MKLQSLFQVRAIVCNSSLSRGIARASFRGLPAALFLSVFLSVQASSFASDTTRVESLDLSNLSLEELMNIEITSVSKRPERISEAAAAAYVLTGEEIKRSGFNSIPEVLRLVPGLQVARIGLSDWAVSARGFNGQFASKLLVMVDGRSVYSPAFSGVFWDMLSIPLEDIARIEVIRGPGATMWGANAVNGVINIITKDPLQTQGGYVQAASGVNERVQGTARWGGMLGESTHYRAYGSGFERTQAGEATLSNRDDYWNDLRLGLRVDHMYSENDELQVEGNYLNLRSQHEAETPLLVPPYSEYSKIDAYQRNFYTIARFKHQAGETSDWSVQSYLDVLDDKSLFYKEKRRTFDIEFKHTIQPLAGNTVIWGAGYRDSWDRLPDLTDPESFTLRLFNAFAQDEWSVVPERLRFIFGSKFEHNSYTKWEIQPNLRAVWSPVNSHTFWASVSRAVRTPSRGERSANVGLVTLPPMSPLNPGPLPILTSVVGNEQFDSEKLIAYEAGWRMRRGNLLSLSVDAFYNDYDDFRSASYGDPVPMMTEPIPYLLLPVYLNNASQNQSYGCELASEVHLAKPWRLSCSYTNLRIEPKGVYSQTAIGTELIYPKHQAVIRNSFDLATHLDLDGDIRYVSKLENSPIGEYFTADLRVGYTPVSNVEVFLVGQNLFAKYHREYDIALAYQSLPAQVERTVIIGSSWKF